MISALEARRLMPIPDMESIVNDCLPEIEAAIIKASQEGKNQIRFLHIIKGMDACLWVEKYFNNYHDEKTPLTKIMAIMKENGYNCLEYYKEQQLVEMDIIFNWDK